MTRLNVSGSWDGVFRYPRGIGPDTPFLAQIDDEAGLLSGHIVEPDALRRPADHLHALIVGRRAGTAIDFTKTYDGGGRLTHSVDYAGQLSGDGTTITGVWSLKHMDGTFEMHRDVLDEREEEAEEKVVTGNLVN